MLSPKGYTERHQLQERSNATLKKTNQTSIETIPLSRIKGLSPTLSSSPEYGIVIPSLPGENHQGHHFSISSSPKARIQQLFTRPQNPFTRSISTAVLSHSNSYQTRAFLWFSPFCPTEGSDGTVREMVSLHGNWYDWSPRSILALEPREGAHHRTKTIQLHQP
jgi:hypothetical protein